jgi:uncharacterized protein involved in response to NO
VNIASIKPNQRLFFNGLFFILVYLVILVVDKLNIYTLELDVNFYHTYSIVYIGFTQFFIGFFLTIFPNLLEDSKLFSKVHSTLYYPVIFGGLLFYIGIFINIELTILGMVLLFIFQLRSFYLLYKLLSESNIYNRSNTLWIYQSLISGSIAHLLYILAFIPNMPYSSLLDSIALQLSIYTYLFSTAIVIIQRLIPTIVKNRKIDFDDQFLEMIFLLSLFHVLLVVTDSSEFLFLSDIPILVILTYEVFRWGLSYYMRYSTVAIILEFSLFWAIISFFLSSLNSMMTLYSDSEVAVLHNAPIHSLVLGFFTTFAIGFGIKLGFQIDKLSSGIKLIIKALLPIIQILILFVILKDFPSLEFSLDIFEVDTPDGVN